MTPYWSNGMITLYHADARDLVGEISSTTMITDPVWPGASVPLIGSDDPFGLFHDVLELLTPATIRIAVHLGTDSDPRFLCAVPIRSQESRAAILPRWSPLDSSLQPTEPQLDPSLNPSLDQRLHEGR